MTRKQRLELRKAALVEGIQSISTAAEADGQRSLSEAEKSQTEKAFAEIAQIDADIAFEDRIEQSQRSLPARSDANTVAVQNDTTEQRKLPAVPKRYSHGSLRSFKGANADEAAYRSGKWLLATIGRDERALQWCKDNGVEVRTHTESSDPSGGYLVIPEFEMAIIDLREQYGVFRQNARPEPMASDSKIIPRRTGGLTAYFVGEETQITDSTKGWGKVELTAQKIGVLAKYSSELSEDAMINVADDFASEIAYAFANKEDECGFNGDGTSTYGKMTGLKNALLAGSKYTAASGNLAFSTLDLADFEGMVGKLPNYPGIQPKWFIHKSGWAQSMLRLLDAAGGNTSAQLQAGVQPLFLGYPVVWVNVMNSTLTDQSSTTGLVYFGDLRMSAALGSRRGVTIATDPSRFFELDQLAVRGTERFAINVHETGTASAAGSMIVLATPAS